MAGVRQAYPEVAASVRTAQLAHRLLARKAQFVQELACSGAHSLILFEALPQAHLTAEDRPPAWPL